MKVFAGAYAASPALHDWDAELERSYLDAVATIPGLNGLELPWFGALHNHDPQWLLSALPSGLEYIVTGIPRTVARLAADPRYGLASRAAEGRSAAIADIARLRDDVHRLMEATGASSVVAVELHSAPLLTDGGVAELGESLHEIQAWDWGGADLVIEHCDALVAGQKPAKGYLELGDEIEAAAASAVGIALNWGRSAIELRDADAVVSHVRQVSSAGLLRGIVFSGASDRVGRLGAAWEDRHLPFDDSVSSAWGDRTSLLTIERTRDALREAGHLDWVGVKFGWPNDRAPVGDRVTMLEEAVRLLREEDT